MERDFVRHQQPVMGGDEPRRVNWKVWLAPAACVIAVLAILGMARSGEGKERLRAGSEAEREPAPSGLAGDAERFDVDGLDARAKRAMDALLTTESAEDGAMDSFLTVLADELGARPENGVRCVAWEERGSLPDTAQQVLRAYQSLGTASLMAAGYLDLKGNAWAALVQLEGGCADVMTVMTEDDAVSRVRVARLAPEGDAG